MSDTLDVRPCRTLCSRTNRPLVPVCAKLLPVYIIIVIHHCRDNNLSLQLRELDHIEWYFVASKISEFEWKASHVDRSVLLLVTDTDGISRFQELHIGCLHCAIVLLFLFIHSRSSALVPTDSFSYTHQQMCL
jgi:hypothetical protein